MTLLDQINQFQKRLVIFLTLSILLISCNTQRSAVSSYDIIRTNYFDTSAFSLMDIDTNKVDLGIYQDIFNKVKLDSSTRCLLLKSHFTHVVWEEYGLFDYKTGKYYYTSLENKRPDFSDQESKRSMELYDIMKEYINNPDSSARSVVDSNRGRDRPYHAGSIELSLLTVNMDKKEILVKSYHW